MYSINDKNDQKKIMQSMAMKIKTVLIIREYEKL